MHTEPWELTAKVKAKYPKYFDNSTVLEVGSLNINGSVRSFFTNCTYIGLDLGEGPGVDVVCPIHEYSPADFDVVISTEMLEHDVHWQESLAAMVNKIKPGGLFVFTCAGPNRHEHGTKRTTPGDAPFTTDYYRNISIDDFKSVVDLATFDDANLYYERDMCDLLFYGIKK
jgi:SAM-dependent methyltransferase